METIEKIKSDPTYQKILKDSFGGIIYNVANRNKYDTKTILTLWSQLTPSEKDSAGGIMEGAFAFIQGR
jgi:hypothetical protein